MKQRSNGHRSGGGNGASEDIAIPDRLFASPEYRKLALRERYLLIELLALACRVGTDVPINCSASMAANMCGVSKSHAATAMLTLEARGFLVRIQCGERRGGSGFASAWRITCLPYHGEKPTFDYQRKVADDHKHETKFMTRELDRLWVETEASFARRNAHFDDEEHAELMAKMDEQPRENRRL